MLHVRFAHADGRLTTRSRDVRVFSQRKRVISPERNLLLPHTECLTCHSTDIVLGFTNTSFGDIYGREEVRKKGQGREALGE